MQNDKRRIPKHSSCTGRNCPIELSAVVSLQVVYTISEEDQTQFWYKAWNEFSVLRLSYFTNSHQAAALYPRFFIDLSVVIFMPPDQMIWRMLFFVLLSIVNFNLLHNF